MKMWSIQTMKYYTYGSHLNHKISGTSKGSSGTTTGMAGGSSSLAISTATPGSGKSQ